MSRGRDSITPMDYEWQNTKGPVDERSPFITGVHSQKKRPHSVFESPLKSAFNTPNRPQLREPHSERYLFSQGNKPLPAVPSHVSNSKTWEPRTPASVIDFSSGGETPNTPAQDSDAATPDTQMADKMGRLMNDGVRSKSPKKKRESFFRTFFSSPSPSKEDRKLPYTKKAENRVMKRRSKNRKIASQAEYDSDESSRPSTSQGALGQPLPGQPGYAKQAGDFLTWVEAHPSLPSVLAFYFQLLVNILLGLGFLYILYSFWAGIMADIGIERKKNMAEVMVEIAHCAKEYNTNRCHPDTRVPAMQAACGNWEACMAQDPKQHPSGKITAKTFASILNAFIEEFSYKSMLFTFIVIFGGFNLSNWAFGVLRGKNQQYQTEHQSFTYPPPTPQRHPSGPFIEQQGFYTPYQTPYGSMNQGMLQQATQSMPALPAPDSIVGVQEDKRKSPAKRRLFA